MRVIRALLRCMPCEVAESYVHITLQIYVADSFVHIALQILVWARAHHRLRVHVLQYWLVM